MSYSLETVRHYGQVYPGQSLYWILGADQFVQLDRWHAVDELARRVHFLVVARSGSALQAPALAVPLHYRVLEAAADAAEFDGNTPAAGEWRTCGGLAACGSWRLSFRSKASIPEATLVYVRIRFETFQ